MAVSADLLNSTLADLSKTVENSFVKSSPFLKELQKSSQINTSSRGGSSIDRAFYSGSPSQGIGISTGYEVATPVALQKTKKYSVGYYEIFVPIVLAGKEIRQNSGSQGAFQLIKTGPLATLDAFNMDFNKYLLTGTTDSLLTATPAAFFGFSTLNGDFAAGTELGTTNGLLDFAVPGSQTDVVQNVAKDAGVSHYNQYGLITAMATDGETVLKSTYRKCLTSGGSSGGPNLLIMDDASYGNYEVVRKDAVRVVTADAKNDGSDLGTVLYNSKVIYDLNLSLSAFSGTGTGGVTYLLNTKFFELDVLAMPKIQAFQDKLVDQDVMTSKLLFHGALVCTRLPAQGCIGGGATL
jgi:hypothetical protein